MLTCFSAGGLISAGSLRAPHLILRKYAEENRPTKTCETTKEQLTPKTQKQGEIDTSELPPDLAEIVDIWPQLPEAIRSAIVAIVRSSNDQ